MIGNQTNGNLGLVRQKWSHWRYLSDVKLTADYNSKQMDEEQMVRRRKIDRKERQVVRKLKRQLYDTMLNIDNQDANLDGQYN